MEIKTNNDFENEIEKPLPWLRKRKITTYAFVIESFFLGVEYSVFFLTSWLYIETLVKPENPKLVYSITSTAYLMSNILLSLFIGKIADITRQINKLFVLSNILVVIGNVMYTLHFSVYYLILGRLIAGAAAPLRCVISGELARAYTPCELSTKMTLIGVAYGSGFVFGPAINFMFLSIDIRISDWHITVANAAGLFMSIVFVILTIIFYFLVHDLSKEFDLKSKREKLERKVKTKENENGNINENTPLVGTAQSRNSLFKATYFRSEVILLFICSYIFLFAVTYYDMAIPIMVIDILNQTAKELNAIMVSAAVWSIVISLWLIKKPLTDEGLFYMLIVVIFLGFGSLVTFCCIKLNGKTNVINTILWVLFVLLFGPFAIIEQIYLMTTFAKFLPSSQQIFGESLRVGFERLGSVTALMASAYLFDWNDYFSIVTCTIIVFIFIAVIFKRTSLQNPAANI